MVSSNVPTSNSMAAVAALTDELRRGMYEFIRRARRPVGRDEAAAAVGISRKLAAFHLDKLVDAGLLCARFEPVGGIRKVGRTPKVYEPTDAHIGVSIPPRRPDLLAEVLLDAVLTEGDQETAIEAALRTAREHGHRLGTEERIRSRPGRLGPERALTKTEDVLTGYGFEPDRETPTCVRLRNCPFHPLTAQSPELVCGLNRAFLQGFLAGLQARSVEAVLDPRVGECCVAVRSR
ncbi:helix-turn-helix transcriptional regulator [Saccharopolyspora phatthalungensis]|uniref:Putative ArsR family transcriptional regulator n=1 Tax=Saccharopolyspora phatthalungensis TaxID=664693 RepID=A0A840Q0S8_9PSEU|nr:transcriptional regulator [Saccharopolyspora phatthalungensis]MBB5153131.1 putative ArsR family transcriptional regulator [Saccharopolyspora phatthalungensis]